MVGEEDDDDDEEDAEVDDDAFKVKTDVKDADDKEVQDDTEPGAAGVCAGWQRCE